MKKIAFLLATAAMAIPAVPAVAQTSTSQSTRDRLGDLLGTIFGRGVGANTSIDAQWAAGRTPITNQRAQFESRVDAEVRAGNLDRNTGQRLTSDYYALAQLEGRYGSDGRFTTQERAELTSRYNALTQVLANGGYADNGYQAGENSSGGYATSQVADGRADFERRVDAAVAARRVTRTQGTRLKADYASAVQLETDYLRDGALSTFERDDLDTRLDALDSRLGDVGYQATPLTARSRLTAITSALPYSGLSTAMQAQLRIEVEDITRLEAAYSRLTVSADERAYLERRLSELEARVRPRR